ncbi:MAG: polysaccharide deacetylase family protein [Chitinophagales bacterium]
METNIEESGERFVSRFCTGIIITFSFLACRETNKESKKISYGIAASSLPEFKTSIARPSSIKKKKIYLTFDDGPNKGTRNVLSIIEQENVPATFFIIGEHVVGSAAQNQTWDSLKTAKNIELCNHSYTHAMHNHYAKFYNHPDSVVKEVVKTQEELQLQSNIVRAPGRNCWRIDSLQYTDIKKSKAAIDSLQNAGFIVIGWDLEWHFDPQTLRVQNTADELLKKIDSVFKRGKTKTSGNLVLLAHDQVYQNRADSAQLRELVQKLKQKDEYELLLVKDYPGIMKPGTGSTKAKTTMQQ